MALGSPKNRVGDESLPIGSRFWGVPYKQEGGTWKNHSKKEGEPFSGCLRYEVILHGCHLGRGPDVYL